MKSNPLEILKRVWGYASFKGSQESIIDSVLEGKDVVALLPTGGGKSLCFQLPALAKEGICIVVSPLVALIRDQVRELQNRDIKAMGLTGGLTTDELVQAFDNCLYGGYKFLYLSPERIQQPLVQNRLRELPVSLIAIDEAHCISQWGNDFRPAYLECAKLREFFPDAPVMALTATATTEVVEDIIRLLLLKNEILYKDSFSRSNISFQVRQEENKRQLLIELCAENNHSGLVYVRSRRLSEELSLFLEQNGISARSYHGGQSPTIKNKTLDGWLRNDFQYVVATNAFGMGIDKADVRLVIHYQIPDTIESYFQEAGRAGRDGYPSKAIMLVDKSDDQRVVSQFIDVLPDVNFIKKVYHKLNMNFQVGYAELKPDALSFDFDQFCDQYGLQTSKTYNALKILDQHSIISLIPNFSEKTTLKITASKEQIWNFIDAHSNKAPVIQAIVRTYGGIFEFPTVINLHRIAKKLKYKVSEVKSLLQTMQTLGLVEFTVMDSDLQIIFLIPREDQHTINRIAGLVEKFHKKKILQVQEILKYISFTTGCRHQWLLAYFGEKRAGECGRCDWCLGRSKVLHNDKEVAAKIKMMLQEHSKTSREIITHIPYEKELVIRVLQSLLEDGDLSLDKRNEFHLLK